MVQPMETTKRKKKKKGGMTWYHTLGYSICALALTTAWTAHPDDLQSWDTMYEPSNLKSSSIVDKIFVLSSFLDHPPTSPQDWLQRQGIPFERLEKLVATSNPKWKVASQDYPISYLVQHAAYYNITTQSTIVILSSDKVYIPHVGRFMTHVSHRISNLHSPVLYLCNPVNRKIKLGTVYLHGSILLPNITSIIDDSSCLVSGFTTHSARDERNKPGVGWIESYIAKVPLEHLQRERSALSLSTPMFSNPPRLHGVDRIFYLNLKKNSLRRQAMEFQLSKMDVPWERVVASRGTPDDKCIPEKSRPKMCRGVAGLCKTLVHVLDHPNSTKGLSLILEDDFILTDRTLDRLSFSLSLVPDDWDLIRFDCWKTSHVKLQTINAYVLNTTTYEATPECRAEQSCHLCTGTYAMLIRGDRRSLLREMWSTVPYDDADCRIVKWGRLHGLKSYCVNIGIGDMYHFESEKTDIPKLGHEPHFDPSAV